MMSAGPATLLLAAIIASRSEQSVLQTPSAVSAVFVTVNVVASAGSLTSSAATSASATRQTAAGVWTLELIDSLRSPDELLIRYVTHYWLNLNHLLFAHNGRSPTISIHRGQHPVDRLLKLR